MYSETNLLTVANLFLVATIFFTFMYVSAIFLSNRKPHLQKWPLMRLLFWLTGVLSACIALAGPLAEAGHHDFRFHMGGHLLLGMLAPLLIALSAPMTLLLRSLSTKNAKRCTYLLKSRFARFYVNPVTASVLNIGGLWLLYATPLFNWMHSSPVLFFFVHIHIFAAGYLFTISIIYIDPVSHRHNYTYRTVVFIAALAVHGILSKYIYTNPPDGVLASQAQSGAMLMYYGGDLIDLVLIILLFRDWYQSAKPRQQEEEACLSTE
ncbi:cytochrome c oxidase assembly protein [Aciduricibacillus chroicocephali]|uniref:Cytochrome c oxidase assembly protein n=1 Tax=Aciduricibacillus chroicocephali TaxID=3054939 RepID=A0ABY9KXT7_9BACI|nr:cytochrome c oxidase assembly protein [Bacillaceae bacterium 44XB]